MALMEGIDNMSCGIVYSKSRYLIAEIEHRKIDTAKTRVPCQLGLLRLQFVKKHPRKSSLAVFAGPLSYLMHFGQQSLNPSTKPEAAVRVRHKQRIGSQITTELRSGLYITGLLIDLHKANQCPIRSLR